MTARPADPRHRLAEAILERRRRQAEHPLRYARLWEPACSYCGNALTEVLHPIWRCDTAGCQEHGKAERHTSQKRAAQNLGEDATLIAGGNGTGKTRLGAQFFVAAGLGRDHPDVQAWAAANGIDTRCIQPGPATVVASSLQSNLSRLSQRPEVKALLPAGAKWKNEDGDGMATAEVDGTTFVFLTNDAGRRAFQSFKAPLIWLDEEHDRDVFEECQERTSRVKWADGTGWILYTMTPLKGLTYVYTKFVEKPEPGFKTHFLHGRDNPYLEHAKRRRIMAGRGEHERAARERGEFTAMEGRVYSDWSRQLHVIPAYDLPREWPRYRAIDFGTRNPFCCLWLAWDPHDDVLHVYREHYQAGWPTKRHGQEINRLSADDPPVEWTAADPESLDGRLTLLNECDLDTLPAVKDVREGINAVAERLHPDAEGRPHLLVHDCCVNLAREMDNYVWMETQTKADQADKPLKRDDHACDCLRYGLLFFARQQS